MINFIKFRKLSLFIASLLFFFSLFFIFINKFNFGLEFIGGVEFKVKIHSVHDINLIKDIFKESENIKIRYYGSNRYVQIKIKNKKENIEKIISEVDKKLLNKFDIVRINIVSPEISIDVIKNTFISVFIAMFSMFIYVIFRFRYELAISSFFTLCYNIFLVLGFISFFKIEFDLIVLAAIFAIFGYSINDTIIIFDRFRENLLNYANKDLNFVINLSINLTLSRTITTSLSTLFVVLILLVFAGDYLFGFSLVLFFGITVGTFSSIFLSNLPLILFKNFK